MVKKRDSRTKQQLLAELETLQAAQAMYATLVEKASEGVLIIQDGLVQFANPKMLDISGFSREEVLTRPFLDFLRSPYKEMAAENYRKRMSGEDAPQSYEIELITKDGRSVFLEISGSAFTYLGKPADMAFVRDITERKQADERLRRNERLLKIFVEHSPAAIAMFDCDMRYIVASRRYLADFGLGDQNLIGRSHYDVFPELSERVREVHRRCLAGAVEGSEEDEFLRLSGKVDWVYWEMLPWYESDGVIGGVVLFSEVITERKLAEEVLRQSEEKFRTLAENLPIGIAITAYDGRFLMANEALQRMRGYDSREELMRATISQRYYDPKDRDRWLQMIKEKGKVDGFEIRLKRKDGSLFWASFNSITAVSDSGEQQIINVIQDITERKQAEEAVAASETRYRRLFESAKDGILIINAETGLIIEVNPFLQDLLGFSKTEFLGKELWEIGIFKDIVANKANFEKLRRKGYIRYEDLPLKASDGRVLNVEFVSNVYDVDHQKIIQCNIRDITQRKQAEEALRESEERFRGLVDNAPVGMVLSTLSGGIISMNRSLLKMHGYESQEEFDRTAVSDRYYDPSDRERWLKLVREQGRVDGLELLLKRKDGSLFRASFDTLPQLSTKGEQQFITVVQDITQRKIAEDNLRESEEKYRDLVNTISDGIFATDERGVITFANRALAEIHGFAHPDEITGKAFIEFVIPAQRDEIAETFRQSVMTGHISRNLEVSIIRKDGSAAFIQVNPVPIIENGMVVGVTGVVRDITEQRQIQGQLIAADRLASIGQLAAGIAHELNNPLTAVIGFSELLMSRKNLPDDIREDLETVNREAKRTAGIIRGLLTFAREQKTDKSSVNLNSVVQAVLQLRSYEQRVNNIEVAARLAADLPMITGNAGELQQVFMNLIINAEQAMLEAHKLGKLTVTTERAGDTVKVSFVDDGPGIKLENMPRLFTPFFTTKEVGKGTGLGLSICHGIITGHGGRIYTESEYGKGATFIIELPVAHSL